MKTLRYTCASLLLSFEAQVWKGLKSVQAESQLVEKWHFSLLSIVSFIGKKVIGNIAGAQNSGF